MAGALAMSYDKILISDLETMAAATNYRNWMYKRLAPHIGQRILEIGAGIGNFTELLISRELVLATDNYPPCIDYLNERFGSQLKTPPRLLDASSEIEPSLRDYEFDTIVCLNVLEHIEDDLKALSEMHQVLISGGRLVLLVPAFSFLHGTVDKALGHYRRYTRKDLLPLMEKAGFTIERSFYMNVIGMAGWFWNNRLIKRTEESGPQIRIFDRFFAPTFEFTERLIAPPFGLSLIAIGHKA
jgi:ubiquinone/menaquinone biosynthesis C-methylase UbiE